MGDLIAQRIMMISIMSLVAGLGVVAAFGKTYLEPFVLAFLFGWALLFAFYVIYPLLRLVLRKTKYQVAALDRFDGWLLAEVE
ncbi:hypothetical protein [Arenibacterium sp. CAU 1754]